MGWIGLRSRERRDSPCVNANDLPCFNLALAQAGNRGRSVYVQNCAARHGDDPKFLTADAGSADIEESRPESSADDVFDQAGCRSYAIILSMSDEDLESSDQIPGQWRGEGNGRRLGQ